MPKPALSTHDRAMSQSSDGWYVRFPDGRIKLAATTAILRKQLHLGRIPLASSVRRAPDEEWVTLDWADEFADLVKKPAANGAKQPAPRK